MTGSQTNWYDQVFGHVGKTFNHDLNITGGSEKFRYAFTYAGLRSDEIMLSSRYSRDNLSLKMDHDASDKVGFHFHSVIPTRKSMAPAPLTREVVPRQTPG